MTDPRRGRRAPRSLRSRLAPMLLPLLPLLLGSPAAEANPTAWYIIDGSTFSELIEEDRSVETVPVDVTASAWDGPLFEPDDPHGMWVYADRTGRVRTFVRTGFSQNLPHSRWGRAALVWTGTFVRDSSPVTFTINPSRLHVFSQTPGPFQLVDHEGNSRWTYGKLRFEVWLCTSGYTRCPLIFRYKAKMEGILPELYVDYNEAIGIKALTLGLDQHPFVEGVDEEPTWYEQCFTLSGETTCVKLQTGLTLANAASYEEEIDLDQYGIPIGGTYTIGYDMYVEAGAEDIAEQYAEVILGDPLDAGMGGLSLGTSHVLANDARPQMCTAASDPTRFVVDGASVADTRTGLVWQRCAAGTSLDDNGTPQNHSDDYCVATPAAAMDWQAALASSAGDTTAGHDDWRLPNVKELETLALETCAYPALDQTAFPPMGGASRTYWSATPAADHGQAWIVDFATGDFMPRDRALSAHARFVRQAAGEGSRPATGVSVGDAEAPEGDSGTSPLVFPLRIAPAPLLPMTVEYSIAPLSATEGQDFSGVGGVVAIPAGATSAAIEVPVAGDLETEGNEVLFVTLDAVSGDGWIARGRATGVIVDDEPRPRAADAVAAENSGSLEFVVRLAEPAEAPLTFDYATAAGTAAAGVDFTALTGSAIVNIGEDRVSIPIPIVDDAAWENDETLSLELSGPGFGAGTLVTGTILDDDLPQSYQALNDTGVDYCADAASALLACPQPGFPNQDGENGRDLSDPDDTDGINGFSFTKLDAAGMPLADQSAPYAIEPWSCVRDEVTGLTWEVKSDTPGDLRHYDWTYTWRDSDGVNDGGDAGTANGGVCANGSDCDTEAYAAAVNAAGLCGFSDWRAPSIDEIYTLARTATPAAEAIRGLDSDYFPHNYSTSGTGLDGYSYWTSTPFAADPDWAWNIKFRSPDPQLNFGPKSAPIRVRLVR